MVTAAKRRGSIPISLARIRPVDASASRRDRGPRPCSTAAMPSILFKNAALLDPLQPDLLAGHDVLVEDSLIKEVSDRPLRVTADRTIDLKGKTLMPGLIDLHVHAIAVELNLAQQVHMPNVLVTLRSTLL